MKNFPGNLTCRLNVSDTWRPLKYRTKKQLFSYTVKRAIFFLRSLAPYGLCVPLLVIQSAEATHIHDDDQSRLECGFCSNFTGADEKNILITNFCLQVNPAKETFLLADEVCNHNISIPTKSRSPPNFQFTKTTFLSQTR
mgnify:CR=1 FL=1